MDLLHDPQDIERFKADLRQIPGYPAGEELPIRELVFQSDVLDRLPSLLMTTGARPELPLAVVMDETPMWRSGEDLKGRVMAMLTHAGWRPEVVQLKADSAGQVHTTLEQIQRVTDRLAPKTAVLSVGSGTVTDIAKHACYLQQRKSGSEPLPLTVYATANSVSAYTSNMTPLSLAGVKRTVPSRYPDVVVFDLETLRDAPPAMTVAGVGDLLAGFGSFADWFLASQLGMDSSYNEFARALMGPLDAVLLSAAEAIRRRTLEGMSLLAKLICLGGLAMSISCTTAPLSGLEHVISHVLDLLAQQRARRVAQHGSQVALATVLTTEAYRVFLSEFSPAQVQLDRCFPSEAEMHARIRAAFQTVDRDGRVTDECWSEYQPKLEAWLTERDRFEDFLRHWPTVRDALSALVRPPKTLIRILRAVESPLAFEQLDPPVAMEEAGFAFRNAPFFRRRLTLGDLLVFLGWDGEALWRRVSLTIKSLPTADA